MNFNRRVPTVKETIMASYPAPFQLEALVCLAPILAFSLYLYWVLG